MQPSPTDKAQISFLLPDLEHQLDSRNTLFRLARAMDWSVFEKEFRPLYCTEGRPALPIRRLVGLLMLKSLRNLSDEEVVVFWSENPYAQDFCGEREMQWGVPCDASELTHFRKRIGTAGAEKILAAKIVRGGVKMAGRHGLKLRQSFERTVPKLLAAQRGRRPRQERPGRARRLGV
jgi:hypothetical protein